MGDLIHFPVVPSKEPQSVNQRSCVDCRHALFGRCGTWCELHRFDIGDEVAEACGCQDYET